MNTLALIKKFHIHIDRKYRGLSDWKATIIEAGRDRDFQPPITATHRVLDRAVQNCVAKMRKEKNER